MKRRLFILIVIMMMCVTAAAESSQGGVDMTLGEFTGDYYAEVKLFYESGNGMELTSVTRNVYVPQGGSLVVSALNELFSTGADQEYISRMPGDASVRSVFRSGNVVTVDLNVDMASVRDEGELVSMVMAITNTLTSLNGVEHVNVLINSRSESVSGLPMGALDYSETAAYTIWSMIQAESVNFAGLSNTNIAIQRDAVLYFPSTNGQWVLPEVRNITFESDDYAAWLIAELMAGPGAGEAYASFITSGSYVLSAEPFSWVSPEGERVLEISLSGIVRDYMLLQDIPEWQLAAAITMTMCEFVPETDAVRILIDGEPVTQLNIKGRHMEFSDGLMRRKDFDMYAGSTCTLYFKGEEGTLHAVQRSISAERACSPYALVTQLISGPSAADEKSGKVMPAGVTVSDLLGVSVVDGIATVNMSANFYRLCQALSEDEERVLVYSLVNTLCGLPDITAVSIKVEGESIDSLSGSICLSGYLIPNPGIVR